MATSDSAVPSFYAETVDMPRQERRTVSRERFSAMIALSEASADFALCAFGIREIHALCILLHIGEQTQYPATAASIIFSLFIVLLLHREGGYRGSSGLLQIRETERIIRSSILSMLLLLMLSFILGLNFFHDALLIAVVLISFLLVIEKKILFSIIRRLHLKGYGVERVVVYAAGDTGQGIISTLFHAPRSGFFPVAMIDNNPTSTRCLFETGYRHHLIPLWHGSITSELLESCRCSRLMIATSKLSSQQLAAATYAAKQAGLGITLLYDTSTPEGQWRESANLDGLLLTSSIELTSPWLCAIAKRTVDLVISSLLILLLAPLLLLIAILIRLDSSGPAFFVQKRVGRNGKLFNIYKFRSMHTDAPMYDLSPTTSNDPRITGLGRVIRRTSLDELPQLINVFLGNMSLVGPRPEMPFIVEHYNAEQRQRLQVTPGITGLWQLSSDRAFPIHYNIHYDLYYIRNRTFFMDVAILFHTFFFAMRRGI